MRSILLTLAALLLLTSTAFAGPNPVVVLETTKGTAMVMLYPDKSPNTVKNFLTYVNSGFYDGTIFHRVIPGFVVQGGGFTPVMDQKETMPPIAYESGDGLTNDRGTLSMARTQNPDSATSQFYVNLQDNTALNHQSGRPGYTVFGKVVRGMEVFDTIAKVRTSNHGMYQDVPATPVLIKRAYVYKEQ